MLTPRESEIFELIAKGHRVKEIAKQLNISDKTVEKHRANLMEKLNIHSSAGLVSHLRDRIPHCATCTCTKSPVDSA